MTARSVAGGHGDPGPLFLTLGTWLAGAAAIELLVLRSFTRTAIHIPAMSALAGPYRAITVAGRFDYYIAAVLLAGCLPLAAVALGRRCGRAGLIAAAGLGLFATTAFCARSGLLGGVFAPPLATLALALLVGGLFEVDRRAGLAMGVYLLAFALTAADATAQSAAQAGAPQVDGRSLLWFAEAGTVASAGATLWAFPPRGARRWGRWAVAAGALTLVVLIAGASTAKILLLWNQGLTGALPAVAYAAAAAALTATFAGLIARRRLAVASGLLLVVVGGIGLHSTNQSGLAMVGLAVLMVALAPTPGPTASSELPSDMAWEPTSP